MIIGGCRHGIKTCSSLNLLPFKPRSLSFWPLSKNKPSTSDETDSNKKDDPELEQLLDNSMDFDNKEEQEKRALAKYEQIKDLSKMKPWHRAIFYDEITPPDQFEWQKERWALKERYAKYGQNSGVDPGLMWMTKQELDERKAEENEWNPQLAETIKLYKENKETRQKWKVEKIKQVDENLKAYPALMESFLAKKRSKKIEIEQAEEERAQKLKEIRESFGYDIEETDPRFKVKLMMMQQEEKTKSKLAKKEEKKARMLEKMRAMTSSLASQMPLSASQENNNTQQQPPASSSSLESSSSDNKQKAAAQKQ